MLYLIKKCYLAFKLLQEMPPKTQSKKKVYDGKNVRISDAAFDKVKLFVDEKGLKLGRFVEDAVLEKLQKEKK